MPPTSATPLGDVQTDSASPACVGVIVDEIAEWIESQETPSTDHSAEKVLAVVHRSRKCKAIAPKPCRFGSPKLVPWLDQLVKARSEAITDVAMSLFARGHPAALQP